ncbi:hypothetical protein [Pedobacter sp. SYP-B3415]|uniref:hypothetical protein n=1 Tax=Pedobacter sp. SYP-B3415 TaxID=2496641 RepID=UPI00101CC007|nr:hypothetical protein [Pedobacter sp. SYP-B3415]
MREYTETQRLALWWLPLFLIFETIITGSILFFGPEPLSWSRLEADAFLPVLVLFLPWLLLLFMRSFRFEFSLSASGIHYRSRLLFWQKRTLPWSAISRAWVRSFDALGEYGGWGVRYRLWFKMKDKAFIFEGHDRGLQLELKNGRKLLFGSVRPLELELFIEQLNNNHPEIFAFPDKQRTDAR